jgi:hypothetical protein
MPRGIRPSCFVALAFSALTERRPHQHNPAMVRSFATWLVAPLLLCGGGCDQPEQFDDVRKSVDSWEATLLLSTEQWERQQVPTTFMRQIAEAAGKTLKEEGQRLAKLPADPYGARQLQEERLKEVRRRLQALSEAVDGGNNGRAAAAEKTSAGQRKGTRPEAATVARGGDAL